MRVTTAFKIAIENLQSVATDSARLSEVVSTRGFDRADALRTTADMGAAVADAKDAVSQLQSTAFAGRHTSAVEKLIDSAATNVRNTEFYVAKTLDALATGTNDTKISAVSNQAELGVANLQTARSLVFQP